MPLIIIKASSPDFKNHNLNKMNFKSRNLAFLID